MAYRTQFSSSNGTTDVTILTAPSASTSRTINAGAITIANNDTELINVTLQINDNSTDRVLYPNIEILAGDVWTNQKSIHCIDATTQTLEIFLAAATTTTAASIAVVYRDEVQ